MCYTTSDVVDENEEQDGSKNCPLRDSTDYYCSEGKLSAQDNLLTAIRKEGLDPSDELWMYTILFKLLEEESVIYLVEGFTVV